MFYTINLSPLLVTKSGFMLTIILSYATAFKHGNKLEFWIDYLSIVFSDTD